MKKSKAISLILLTSTLFLGCEDQVRNEYASWDDCIKDYSDPSKCQVEKTEESTGFYRAHYYGPWYGSSRTSTYGNNPSSSTHRAIGISRGGFGGSGSHASS